MNILTGSYKAILKPPYKHWRCKPGTMPFQRAETPSSLAIVLTVPSKPLYLGKPTPPSSIPTPSSFFCSWSLTLAVSKGIVQNYKNNKKDYYWNWKRRNKCKEEMKKEPLRSKRRRRYRRRIEQRKSGLDLRLTLRLMMAKIDLKGVIEKDGGSSSRRSGIKIKVTDLVWLN